MSRTIDPAKLQVWRKRFSQFEQSGLTVAQFCQSIGCSVPTFYQWRRRVEQERPQPAFLQVQTSGLRAPSIEVRLPNGITIVVPLEAVDSLEQILNRVA